MIKFIFTYKFIFFLFICYPLVGCQEDQNYKIGKEVIIKIEKFKQQYNRLPNDLS
jgi:hypothetical protein